MLHTFTYIVHTYRKTCVCVCVCVRTRLSRDVVLDSEIQVL